MKKDYEAAMDRALSALGKQNNDLVSFCARALCYCLLTCADRIASRPLPISQSPDLPISENDPEDPRDSARS